jgi:hypothetical protein
MTELGIVVGVLIVLVLCAFDLRDDWRAIDGEEN